MLNTKRPVNLDLRTISFPVPAIASILHRISGVVLFLAIPLLLWALAMSLESAEGFEKIRSCFTSFIGKFLIWAILTALIYHLFAGIRHLFMDAGMGESLRAGRFIAKLVMGLATICSIVIGVWLW